MSSNNATYFLPKTKKIVSNIIVNGKNRQKNCRKNDSTTPGVYEKKKKQKFERKNEE